MKKIAWLALLWGCSSAPFEAADVIEDDGGSDAVVALEANEKIPDARPPDVREEEAEPPPDPCESCSAPEFGEAVCVDNACDFTCPAACTKTASGCDCPTAQCCDDGQCGGVSCNRGQCSGTYTTCDEPRCWAWCTRCQGKRGGHCPPLLPELEVFCECDE